MNGNMLPRTATHKPIDKIAALRRTCLFQGLSENALAEAANCAIPRAFRAGDILFVENENASSLYVVVQGQLRSVRLTGGREQVLSIDGPGAVIGAGPILDGAEFCCTEVADTNADLLSISKPDVHELCR